MFKVNATTIEIDITNVIQKLDRMNNNILKNLEYS